ncbi:MAG: hypothetical protein OQJ89_05390 [Kangiellaceae bacterium]|nr:hypothetical protein [Kangiellaceae bacterium]MCW8999558.1 hypothetical protein [Kangiellaceae bacterium]MCW9016376.1 hypothetical protein [Kangiellaceae bacterium]
MLKFLTWKADIGFIFVLWVGFSFIDHQIEKLADFPFYYDFLTTAKWLLIAGFALHAAIDFFISRRPFR